jgi:hypothetical protein
MENLTELLKKNKSLLISAMLIIHTIAIISLTAYVYKKSTDKQS